MSGADQRLESAGRALLLALARRLLLPQICCRVDVWHVYIVDIFVVLILHRRHRKWLSPALPHVWISAVNHALEIILTSFSHGTLKCRGMAII